MLVIYSIHSKLLVVPIFLECQNILNLTKNIKKITKIYGIKYIYYKNTINDTYWYHKCFII